MICHSFVSVVWLYRISFVLDIFGAASYRLDVNKINELHALLDEENRSNYISSNSCGCLNASSEWWTKEGNTERKAFVCSKYQFQWKRLIRHNSKCIWLSISIAFRIHSVIFKFNIKVIFFFHLYCSVRFGSWHAPNLMIFLCQNRKLNEKKGEREKKDNWLWLNICFPNFCLWVFRECATKAQGHLPSWFCFFFFIY